MYICMYICIYIYIYTYIYIYIYMSSRILCRHDVIVTLCCASRLRRAAPRDALSRYAAQM